MRFGYADYSRVEGQALVFSFKHMLVTLWQCIFPLMKMNLCFLIFCLPVVTIPAAVTALHAGCVDLIRGERVAVLRLFWKTLRTRFLSSWSVLLLLVLPCSWSIVNAVFYFTKVSEQLLWLIPGLCMSTIAVILLLMIPYALTMVARVNLRVFQICKNAFLLVFLNFPFTLCSSLLILLILVLSVLYWLYALPLTALVTFALCSYIGVYFSLYALQKFVLTEEL